MLSDHLDDAIATLMETGIVCDEKLTLRGPDPMSFYPGPSFSSLWHALDKLAREVSVVQGLAYNEKVREAVRADLHDAQMR